MLEDPFASIVDERCDRATIAAWNQQLSQDRAEAVRDYLIGKGIAADRLEAIGYGNSRRIDEGTTAAARSKNRRVELRIID